MPRCPDCGKLKPATDFPLNRTTRSGRGTYCKPCFMGRDRAWREKHHGSTRQFWLRRRYGIDEADVAALIEHQARCCAICGAPGPTHVDHDHTTGAIRGVLCFNCNRVLGLLDDDIETISRAIDYVEGHSGS